MIVSQQPYQQPQRVTMDMEYRYSPAANNGQIYQSKDWVSGEEVSYTYDLLKRLSSAVTTGPEWGTAYTYDGFGNLTGKTVTKGTAPPLSIGVDPATNHVGLTDANGNPAVGVGQWQYPYDVENRLMYGADPTYIQAMYGYDPAGKRIAKQGGSNDDARWEFQFYGIGGRRLAKYVCAYQATDPPTFGCAAPVYKVYFGGKMLKADGLVVATDRLGSVRYNSNGETFSYYPYGEERTNTADGREKFGTYFRDGPGQDYADQRYYNPPQGRFNTPDALQAGPNGWNLRASGSWNQYVYAGNEPVNHSDPTGLTDMETDFEGPPPQICALAGLAFPIVFCAGIGGAALRSPAPWWDYGSKKSYVASLPQVVAHPIATILQNDVHDGVMTDCRALAAFADTMATLTASTSAFVQSFGVLTPAQLASKIGGAVGVAWNTGAVALNTGQASGYAGVYQNTNPDGRDGDPSWNGDQGHHFAAFFQLGYFIGADGGANAALAFETGESILSGGPLNLGDVILGRAAAQIGADLRSGNIAPADVSSKIRDLCAK